jgi:hypothetical protein
MALPLAHFGHVLVDLPIFFGPVLVLTLWLVIVSRRGRREDERDRDR